MKTTPNTAKRREAASRLTSAMGRLEAARRAFETAQADYMAAGGEPVPGGPSTHLCLSALIAYSFATAEKPCPCSDAALREIEAAARAIGAAQLDATWGQRDTDSISDLCGAAGNEIARRCPDGASAAPGPDWGAFVSQWRKA